MADRVEKIRRPKSNQGILRTGCNDAGRQTIEEPRGGQNDPYQTLVPSGLYEIAHTKTDNFKQRDGRLVWRNEMIILSQGPHFGRPIWFFLNAVRPDSRPGRGRIASTFALATDLRPPKHLRRIEPGRFLKGCVFEAKVVKSEKDSDGVVQPAMAYSKVKHLTRRVAGTSELLTSRGSSSGRRDAS